MSPTRPSLRLLLLPSLQKSQRRILHPPSVQFPLLIVMDHALDVARGFRANMMVLYLCVLLLTFRQTPSGVQTLAILLVLLKKISGCANIAARRSTLT